MRNLFLMLTLVLASNVFAHDLYTERNVEVSQYVGKWYSHYALPQTFTRKCLAQTAEYEVINETTISVHNLCLKKKGTQSIRGKAVVTNPGDNSKLIVTFNNFFTRLFRVKGDYNIIKLDSNYEYVLIGSKDRKSLWLMSRSEVEVPGYIKESYLSFAQEQGFDTSKLVKSKF
jgi:apolipoprotein D and lipocalin family protein